MRNKEEKKNFQINLNKTKNDFSQLHVCLVHIFEFQFISKNYLIIVSFKGL